MADIIEQPTVEQQPQVNEELATQMAISLNNGLPIEEKKEVVIDQPPVEQDTIVDADEYLKTNLGYESWEAAKAEIEQLRQLKDNPTKDKLKFENDRSREIFEALQAGKDDEVFNILSQQRQLNSLTSSEVTKDTAGDIIKLGMKLKFTDLTDKEIEYKFNKEFSIPKEPVRSDIEDDEEFEARVKEWNDKVADIEMNKIIEAKLVKPNLDAAKSKLVLPKVEPVVDEKYAQYLESLSLNQKAAIENTAEYKKYTPKVLETKINFNDEANKIAFEFQYEPDSESFSKVIETICDNQLFESAFLDQDGNLDRKKFADVIYYGLNKDKIIMEALKQAKNATIKSMLPDNSSGGHNRQLPQGQEMSDLDKLMQASLQGYVR